MIITETDRTNANIVLALIKRRMDYETNAEFRINCYENGREHGYVLSLNRVDNKIAYTYTWIAFAEYRRSDDTVVYTDNAYWNGKLTDKSYEEKVFFSYGNFTECADYIIKLMEEAVDNERKYRAEKEAERLEANPCYS